MIGRADHPAEGKHIVVVGLSLALGLGRGLEGKGGVHVFNFVYIAEEKYGNKENGEDHRKKSKEAEEGEGDSTPGD